MIAVVDYGMSNLGSVVRAVEECGSRVMVTDRQADLEKATHIILPGVGSFADGMHRLRERGLVDVLTEQVLGQKVPFLGICLGMQMLATTGQEGGLTQGLGWIEGEVVPLKVPIPPGRLPHIGWNEVDHDGRSPLFEGIAPKKDFYFVHSFHLVCRLKSAVLAATPYHGSFTSAIAKDNIMGVQFHPEKSQRVGLKLLRNFLSL